MSHHTHEENKHICSCHNEESHSHSCSCCGEDDHHEEKNVKLLSLRFALTIVFMLLAIFVKGSFALTIILYSISYLIISYDIIYNAIYNIFHKEFFDENFLMTLASFVALIVYFINPSLNIDANDAILVMLLYQLGEYLQEKAVDKSKESISKMMDLDIKEVVRINDEKEEIIQLEEIKIDDIIKIKPGDKIPVDGIIIKGESTLNTSSLTGESKPLDVKINDKVLSGCLNLNGLIYIKATTTSSSSTTAKVKELIENASKNKAKSETFIRKFAKIYTPIVILISLCVMFIIPIFLGFDKYFITYLYKGLSIMVISCPCALVISVPLSFFSGIGKNAKNGVLIKGANYLEILSKINHIAFDKTGTITKGNFEVINEEYVDQELAEKLLYAMEKDSSHPIALAIIKKLKDKNINISIDGIDNKPGLGIIGIYHGKEVLIGNSKLLKKYNVAFEEKKSFSTIIYISYDNKYLGYVEISDTLKDNVSEDIKELKNKYQLETYLITGDNDLIANDIAKKVNIKNVYANMLPQDKAKIIASIKDKNNIVAYVGDGINDVATILNADVGIAMKSIGADIAIQAADVVLMNDKISQINKCISTSKKTMKIVKQNIVFSLLIKIIVMVLEIFLTIPMFIAILADVGVCLLAIANSLRIMYGKKS